MLMCGSTRSRVLSWQFLLFCIYRSVPSARLQGLGAQTTVVLVLHSKLTLGIRSYCSVFADTVQAISSLMPALHAPWLSEL